MIKIGQGIDFHRFEAGRPMILGGVDFGLDYGLAGHSDADVLLHALCDAILGALGMGDIGEHFPDDDDRYKGADSARLLQVVIEYMLERGFRMVNCDLTILGEKPKITPMKERIRKNLQSMLATEHINVKATTTEKMGAVGRGEGLCAMAIVLLEDGAI